MTPIHIVVTLTVAYKKDTCAYILNLRGYDTYYAKGPDITVTLTTPLMTIHSAAYEVSLTTYQFPVITYDPYQITLPYTEPLRYRSRPMLTMSTDHLIAAAYE